MDFNSLFAAMLGMNQGNDKKEYNEIQKLDRLLTEASIPHDFGANMMGGFQLTYYGKKGKPEPKPGVIQGRGIGAVCSAIQGPFSYGQENDRIEISGLLTDEEYANDSVAGNLTAEEVFERIHNHWTSEQNS